MYKYEVLCECEDEIEILIEQIVGIGGSIKFCDVSGLLILVSSETPLNFAGIANILDYREVK